MSPMTSTPGGTCDVAKDDAGHEAETYVPTVTFVAPATSRTVMDDRDPDAFRALYRRHYRSVCRFLASRTAPDHVEDLAAETFLIAWRKAGAVPDMQLPWLLNVAHKCLANHRRSGEAREAMTERLARVARTDTPGVEADAERRRQQRAVIAALAALHERDRELLLLSLWDDLRP